MTYVLGVDLGTTFSAAAIARDGRAETFALGTRSAAVPSVIVVRNDGEVLVGDAAERRAPFEPSRTAREFKRRLGDPTPLLLGGTPYGAEALMAFLLRHIVEMVTAREGAPPDLVVLSHPANYGPYKKDLLIEAVRQADVGDVRFVTEPEAAAIHYVGQQRIEPGEVVAVYDFGGGTFDAAVLRRTENGFDLLGTPEGMDRLGGIDFDHAVFGFVDEALAGTLGELDERATTLTAVSRLRDDCRTAKEALSSDTDATISVLLPGTQTEVRITRDEFEGMIRPRIAETVSSLQRAIRSAGIETDGVGRVLLVGGSSRIPLVAQMVREATGRPVTIDADPKFAIALGAALAGERHLATVVPETPVTEASDAAEVTETAPGTVTMPTPVEPTAPAPPRVPAPPTGHRGRRRALLLAGGGVAAVVAAVIAVVLVTGGGDGDGGGGEATGSTASEASQATLLELEAGDCWDGDVDRSANVELLSCDAPHDFETYAVVDHPDADGDFPGDEELDEFSSDECARRFEDFVGIDPDSSELQPLLLIPEETDWDRGETEVSCSVSNGDGSKLDESVEGSRR